MTIHLIFSSMCEHAHEMLSPGRYLPGRNPRGMSSSFDHSSAPNSSPSVALRMRTNVGDGVAVNQGPCPYPRSYSITDSHLSPHSAVCCPTVITGCCVPGGTCCGATCCGPGVRCSGGVCQDFTLPTTSRTIPTTTTSSLPDACPVNGVKRAVCSGTPVETRVPGVKSLVFDYNKLSKKPKPKYNQAQKDAREKALKEVCNDNLLPKRFSQRFHLQLFTSMCLGLEQRGKVNDDIFTFEGDQKKKDANRKAAGCHGSPCSSFPGESCDEVKSTVFVVTAVS